jgi:antitoxin (DNA-binding transcriptional repressor) of toxin-antitoxin stability system
VPAAFTAIGAAIAGATGGSAATSALPSLYVTYNMQCHFTMTLDSGAVVGPGGVIPNGKYQLVITTPVAFASGAGGCDFINFGLTGPGINYTTQLGEGDETEDLSTQTFTVGSSYTAADRTVAPGTTITFTASSTPVAASSGPPTSSSTSTHKPVATTNSPTKQTTSTPVVNRGTLEGSVSVGGKVSLTFHGKPVTEIIAGRYKVQVVDRSVKSGFTIQQLKQLPTTITGVLFVGTRTATIVLARGQSLYYPSFTGQKSYFLVVAPHQ